MRICIDERTINKLNGFVNYLSHEIFKRQHLRIIEGIKSEESSKEQMNHSCMVEKSKESTSLIEQHDDEELKQVVNLDYRFVVIKKEGNCTIFYLY